MTVWRPGDTARLVLLNARPGAPVTVEGVIAEVDDRSVVLELRRGTRVHLWRVASDSSFLTRLK